MLQQLFAIIRNTFFESIRQPIMTVILLAVTVVLVLSNPLSAFTMDDDQRMLVDIGMATVFLSGALLAAFVATGVLTREIENRTALTVISKPVGRPLFIIGKFLGVAGALLLATLYMSFVFLLVEMHSVLQTVRDPVHVPVIVFGVGAAAIGVGAAIWCNFFYGKVFSSTVLCFTTPLLALAYLFSLKFNHDFTLQPLRTAFKPELWAGLFAMSVAIVMLTAIAIAASARLGQVMTLCVTLGTFVFGLLSDWILGRPLQRIEGRWLDRAAAEGLTERVEVYRSFMLNSGEVQTATTPTVTEVATVPLADMAEGGERLAHMGLAFGRAIVPNFQVLWLSDAITQDHRIPFSYLAMTTVYGVLYMGIALGLAVILFQRREVG